MFSQLMQHIGSRGDRIRTQEQALASLLSSSDETIGSCLITCDIHIASRLFLLTFNAISMIYGRVGVGTIVVSSSNHFHISFCDLWFLGKLITQEVLYQIKVAVEEPAYQTQCKHIATLQGTLVVHPRVFQRFFHDGRDRSSNHILLDAHLLDRIISDKLCFLKVGFLESIGINDDASR